MAEDIKGSNRLNIPIANIQPKLLSKQDFLENADEINDMLQ